MTSIQLSAHPPSQTRFSLQRFALCFSAIYLVLQLTNLLHHPMWRDEMQVWELARQSTSVSSLLYLKRYEGHPDAWYLLVYLAQRISSAPFAMQVLHLVIATSAAYILLRYAPFTRLQKVLAIFGYFLFFEYATISREYALGMLCLFGFCAVFRPDSKSYGAAFLFLTILGQTSVYGLILAIAFTIMMWADALSTAALDRELLVKRKLLGGTLVLAVASTVAAFHILSIGDPSSYASGWNTHLSIAQVGYALTAMSRSFLPLPEPTLHFWNTHLLRGPIEAGIAIVVLCTSLLFLFRTWQTLLAYFTGLFGILLLRYLKPGATHFARHDGHVFLLFLSCAWAEYAYGRNIRSKLGEIATVSAHFRRPILTTVLVIHAMTGIAVAAFAYRTPFSQAKATADYIRSAKLDHLLIVADPEYATSTVAGYLDRPVLFATRRKLGTYVIWDSQCCAQRTSSTTDLALAKATELKQDVLVLVDYLLPVTDRRIRRIATFEGAIVEDENYYLYLIADEEPVSDPSR